MTGLKQEGVVVVVALKGSCMGVYVYVWNCYQKIKKKTVWNDVETVPFLLL